MRKECFGKLDVNYQSAFTASKKPSPPAAAYVSPLKKILYAFTGSKKPSTPSSVARAAYYVSPLKKQYWDVQTNNLRKLMAGMNEEYILDAIYLLRNENPEYHESIMNRLIIEYDELSQSCGGDGTDSAPSEELNKILKCGRNVLDKLDVTYQSAFTASEKPSPPAAAYVSPLEKILYAFTESEKPSTPSSVAGAADYVSPLKK